MYQQNASIPTHTDVRFPHEEVLRDVTVVGHEVLASWAVRTNEIYQYCVKINDVVVKGLSLSLGIQLAHQNYFLCFVLN